MGGSRWPRSAFLQKFLWPRSRTYHLAAGNKSSTWFRGSSSLQEEEDPPTTRGTGMYDVLMEVSLLPQAHLQPCETDFTDTSGLCW